MCIISIILALIGVISFIAMWIFLILEKYLLAGSCFIICVILAMLDEVYKISDKLISDKL